MKKYVKNPSIELTGVVHKEKLKELLAVSDYGLSPIFEHAAGTFIKVLTYLSAGLKVIASPYSLIGLDSSYYSRMYIVKNEEEFFGKIREIIEFHNTIKDEKPLIKLCSEIYKDLDNLLNLIIRRIIKDP
jgi:hypothetical protein